MKITKQDLPRLAKAAQDFIQVRKDGAKLEDTVLSMGSSDETVCLLTLDELEGNGTACGSVGNTCFSGNVIEFLRERGVIQVLVGFDTYEEDCLTICGGVVPIPYEGEVCDDWRKWFPDGSQCLSEFVSDGRVPSPAKVLSELVCENDGSWRDDCCIEGWSSYESE